MAKLEGVKTDDMVGGEITKISYDGAEYGRIDEEAKAQAGDLMRPDGTHFEGDIKHFKFYEVVNEEMERGIVLVIDEEGRENGINRKKCDVFRKISDQSTPTLAEVSNKVDALEKRVSALEGAGKPAQEIEYDGEEYALVNRRAQSGDVVILTTNRNSYFTEGKAYGPVSESLEIEDNDGDYLDVYNSDFGRTETNVLVYEPVKAATEKLKVGDYVKATGGGPYTVTDERMTLGKVVEDTYLSGNITVEVVKHGERPSTIGRTYFVSSRYFRKATDEEIEEATRPKTGDIVVITENTSSSRNAVGDIGKVGKTTGYDAIVDVPGKTEGNGNWTLFSEMRLATPVEIKRYDEAVAAENAPKFEDGDYARTLKRGEFADVKAGAIVQVEFTDAMGDHTIKASLLGGSDYDYFRPQDLEKLEGKDVERIVQFAKAGRKLNEFKKGDVIRALNTSATGHKVGHLAVVERVDSDGDVFTDVMNTGGSPAFYTTERVELIAPVESRADVK